MRNYVGRLANLDRRVIFGLMALAVIIPLLRPFNLPGIHVSPPVQAVFDKMEALAKLKAEGKQPVLLLSMDFDPASKPELYPMAVALTRHAFSRGIRVIGMTLWLTGTGMAEEILTTTAKEMNKGYGQDYVFLGWAPGAAQVIIGMGQDLVKTFPTDYHKTKLAELPMMKGLNSSAQFDYVISLCAGDPGVETWYVFGRDKYKFELGAGCTAVIAPGLYPYLQTGQINGLMGGMKGAAEYEGLLNRRDKATAGMDAQSTTHMLIIALIILSNVFFFILRRK